MTADGIDTTTPPPEGRRLRERVVIPTAWLAALCERYGVRRMAVFGSVLLHGIRRDKNAPARHTYVLNADR